MRKSAALSFAAIGIAAIVAAGCSSGSNNASPGGTPTPVPIPTAVCTSPPGYTIQQVFPQNGAALAPNLQGVVFAVKPAPLPTNWYFYVTSSVSNVPGATTASTTYGTAQIGFLATPSPQPTPSPVTSPGASPSPVVTGTPLPTPSDTPSPGVFVSTSGGVPSNFVYEIAGIGNFANNTSFTVYLANGNCAPPSAIPSGYPLQFNTFTTDINDNPSPSPAPSATST